MSGDEAMLAACTRLSDSINDRGVENIDFDVENVGDKRLLRIIATPLQLTSILDCLVQHLGAFKLED